MFVREDHGCCVSSLRLDFEKILLCLMFNKFKIGEFIMIMKDLTSIETNVVSGGVNSDLTANIDPNELQTRVTQLYNDASRAEKISASVAQLYNNVNRAKEISANVAQLYNEANYAEKSLQLYNDANHVNRR